MLGDDGARPLVIGTTTDDDLDRIVRRQQLEVLPPNAVRLLRARRLDVDDARDTRIDVRDIDRTARLERHVEPKVTELRQQRGATRLRERLAARHTDVRRAVAAHLGLDLGERAPLAARERVRGIAVLAAQRAPGEADEDGGPAAERGL